MNTTTDHSPINLLIAEDFHAETEALLRELKDVEFNFSYVVVKDEVGYEAQLHEFKPDVILSPYSLATTNAVKLLGLARKNGVNAPLILLAYDLSEDIAIDLLGEGIEDYILRSTIKRLPVAIRKALQRKKTELKLVRSQSLLSLGEGISNSGSFELDLIHRTTVWSANFYRIAGIDPSTVITNKLFVSCIHPEDRKPYQDALAANIQHELGKPFVYRIIRPDNGQIVHLQVNGRRIEGEDGDIRWIGSVLDITDRVLAQQEREAQTVQRDLLLSTAKIGIWHWTVGSNKLIWDEGCAKIFDEFLPDLKAARYYELIHPDDRGYVRERLVDGLKTGEYSAEYRLTKNGSDTFVLSRGKATMDKDGIATRIDGIIIDMTDQKKAEEQIKTLSLVASETVNGVLIHDPDGTIIWANKGFTKITGYTQEEVLGKEPWSFLSGQETNQKLVELTYIALSKGKPFSSDNRLVNKSGDMIWVQTTFTPVTDDGGNVTKIVSIGTEITKHKELQGLQREMVARLEKANAELKKKTKD